MKLSRASLVAAALAGGAAVVLGAFGAHALRNSLDASALATWHTAVDYEFWHALALLGVSALARDRTTRSLRVAAIAFVLGILLFCGSLHALALGGPRAIGVITPLGGIAFIVGWIALAIHGWLHEER
ncbi:MAG TPA: DUF423 domain-containing protein [Rhodanobacteraceae bacterium]|jgi:uncharacterized membrane protein YgdD (TMEM256/DUF423 family)|nr:DUF423 domain-containing protein [Rhodanobacteraceae bacterium]